MCVLDIAKPQELAENSEEGTQPRMIADSRRLKTNT
jgi:hypothetical protein